MSSIDSTLNLKKITKEILYNRRKDSQEEGMSMKDACQLLVTNGLNNMNNEKNLVDNLTDNMQINNNSKINDSKINDSKINVQNNDSKNQIENAIKLFGINCNIFNSTKQAPIKREIADKVFNEIEDEDFEDYSVGELNKLYKDVQEEEQEYFNSIRYQRMINFSFPSQPTVWDAAKEKLERILNQREPQRRLYQETKVMINETETENGFQLYTCTNGTMFYYDEFVKLLELYQSTKKWTFEEFDQAMRDECCTDWNKQDSHGECYGGYWKYPTNSEEYKNAFSLCLRDAMQDMYTLPFSKDFLLQTIKIGCSNRQESVRYSNFLGVWFSRKLKAMDIL